MPGLLPEKDLISANGFAVYRGICGIGRSLLRKVQSTESVDVFLLVWNVRGYAVNFLVLLHDTTPFCPSIRDAMGTRVRFTFFTRVTMSDKPVVSLFVQCLVDSMYPDVGDAMVSIFDTLRVPVDFPEQQTCCGQPAFNAGYRKEAAAAAKRFLDIFESAEVIVCPSGSCVHMVRHHYPELFKNDPVLFEKAKAVAAKTFEFSQYLVDELGVTTLGAYFPHKVTYHDSCHLTRGLRVDAPPRKLLNSVVGLEFIEMKDSDACCGFGGTFSVNYPEISTAMVDEKIENILACGAEIVTGCDISCLMNIQGRLSRRGEEVKVMHIAEILAQGQGHGQGGAQ